MHDGAISRLFHFSCNLLLKFDNHGKDDFAHSFGAVVVLMVKELQKSSSSVIERGGFFITMISMLS
jgi:DNA recombination-dependent growth factor C